MSMNSAREAILGSVRAALGRDAGSPVSTPPANTRVASRVAGDKEAEIDTLLAEIAKLGGNAKRLPDTAALHAALAELVKAEDVKKATMWTTPDMVDLGIAGALSTLGVEIVAAQAAKEQLALCELGVTGADAVLPETGSILLRSSPDRPRSVSLVPRVHLAIVRPTALRADLHQALADVKDDRYLAFVTGPSRTADIELTLTIGVHGPKALYVWVLP